MQASRCGIFSSGARVVSHHDARCAARGSAASMIASISSNLSENYGSVCRFRYSRNAA
jgi:hypothetical protein